MSQRWVGFFVGAWVLCDMWLAFVLFGSGLCVFWMSLSCLFLFLGRSEGACVGEDVIMWTYLLFGWTVYICCSFLDFLYSCVLVCFCISVVYFGLRVF